MRILNHGTFLIATPEIYAMELESIQNGTSNTHDLNQLASKHQEMFNEVFITKVLNQAFLFQTIAVIQVFLFSNLIVKNS
jgi:hypothetical protein